jgi:hypothetical protein
MKIAGIGQVIAVLNDLQAKKIITEFAIGGAVAAILHKEPISTVDLDIFFFLAEKDDSPILSLSAIYDYAKKNKFPFDAEFISIYGWLVQFVEASHNPLWIEAIENAAEMIIDRHNILVIGREHLVAMWLLAGRNKDYQKISMFIEANFLDNAKLFDILERHNLMTKWDKEKWRFSDE